jgi:hypothetical protein
MPDFDVRWVAVAACAVLAVAAGIADWRRRRRIDLDRVGPIHWPTVQMLALIAAVVIGLAITHR